MLCAFSAGSLRQRDHLPPLPAVRARALGRPAEVVHVDDVIAAEHARRPMPAERHDRVRVDARLNQVPHAAPAQVVHNAAVEADIRASPLPPLAEVPDRFPIAMEDVGAVEAAWSSPEKWTPR